MIIGGEESGQCACTAPLTELSQPIAIARSMKPSKSRTLFIVFNLLLESMRAVFYLFRAPALTRTEVATYVSAATRGRRLDIW